MKWRLVAWMVLAAACETGKTAGSADLSQVDLAAPPPDLRASVSDFATADFATADSSAADFSTSDSSTTDSSSADFSSADLATDPCAHFTPDSSCFKPGACAAGNVASSCAGGVITPCQTGSPTGVSETLCNGVDDDCDDQTDEDFVPDSSCFKPGVCAAGNAASSCAGGVLTACRTGSPSGVSESLCNGVDDDCNGKIDESAAVTACTKTVNVVIIYDRAAGQSLGIDPLGAIAQAFASAAARFTSADSSGAFSPKVVLNLGAIVSWSDAPPPDAPSPSPSPLDPTGFLTSFETWVTAHHAALDAMAGSPADHVMLLTGDSFSSGTGASFFQSICASGSVSVTSVVPPQQADLTDYLGALLARRVGTNFGLPADGSSGFIMSGTYSPNAVFSSASATALTNYFNGTYAALSNQCLNDAVNESWTSDHCGDGRVGGSEHCDAPVGVSDACCPSCHLAPGCQCADSEPCCNGGVLRSAGTPCRAASGACDTTDECDGAGGQCPIDLYQAPGTACTSDSFPGVCYRKRCIAGTEIVQALNGGNSDYYCFASIPTASRCTEVGYSLTSPTAGSCHGWFSATPPDGIQCGSGEQCLAQSCQASSALTDYYWAPSEWTPCSSGSQSRTASCVDETGLEVVAASCSPTPSPSPLVRGCP